MLMRCFDNNFPPIAKRRGGTSIFLYRKIIFVLLAQWDEFVRILPIVLEISGEINIDKLASKRIPTSNKSVNRPTRILLRGALQETAPR